MRKKILSLFFAFVLAFVSFPITTPAQQVSRQVVIRKISVTLTSAQIKAMNVTPVQIIPAQGAGFLAVPISGYFVYNFVTTAYAISGTGALQIVWNSNLQIFASYNIQTTLQAIASQNGAPFTPSNGAKPVATTANSPVFAILTQAATLGDGTMTITLYYDVIPAS